MKAEVNVPGDARHGGRKEVDRTSHQLPADDSFSQEAVSL